jgi:O-methyltransferase involved in polyketide biosynthesis
VGQGRAAAHGRLAPGRFSDPTAMDLLRDDEREPVEQVRAGTAPSGWSARMRFELVRATAEVMVPRTVRIDDAVRARTAEQLVVLGAGLDGRAWRLDELAGVDVFEVDHPDSQWVPVDLARDVLAGALTAAGHRPDVETTWIWEGVVPYLDRADVRATVAAIAERSAPGSALIVNYQTPSVGAGLGRVAARAMTAVARRPNLWRDEPRRSAWTPAAMRALLTAAGFTVDSDDDLLAIAATLDLPVRRRGSLRNGRVVVAIRA